ncbi:MAG TPA: DUF1559 domain-containing protein [Gemmataceae bacterium]|nr:DUF1559 domain-containing protein [Gemmataceae bacterium]
MEASNFCKRRGFSLIEVLVVIAIGAVLLGLLLPAVTHARRIAARVASTSNLKQMGLAVQNYAEVNSQFLPSFTGYSSSGSRANEGSLFLALLPYLDGGAVYAAYKAQYPDESVDIEGDTFVQQSFGSDFSIAVFIDAADPSVGAGATGLASYAGNALVFSPEMKIGFVRDGTSNTIAFAGRYGNCKGVQNMWILADRLDVFSLSSDLPLDGISRPITPKTGIPFDGPGERRTTFADVGMGDVYPVTTGNPPTSRGSVPDLTFQVAPELSQCDPRIPQTPHSGGMPVAMVDGSVRIVSGGISAASFWGATTPRGGEILGNDWID